MSRFKPWSEPGEAWVEQEDWTLLSGRLWADEPGWMVTLTRWMQHAGGWIFEPAEVNQGHVRDGHHRIVAAMGLGWYDLNIPLREEADWT